MYTGKHAHLRPLQPAFIMAQSGEAVTYRELDARSNRLAHLFRNRGLKRLDHYSIFMENNSRYLEACGAGERSGLYFTCVNSYLTASELAYILTNSQSRVLITSKAKLDIAREALKECPKVELCIVADGEGESDRIVGLQTCIYWLPYVPDQFRFHFNMHNLIVYGREGDDYLVSDPLFEMTTRCPRDSMTKARFAKGALAAKGLMYFPTAAPSDIDHAKLVPQAIKANYRTMVQAPLPMIGIKGIRYLAKKITQLGKRADRDRYLPLYLTHIVRMQEEIGSGGAGFRFIYASFLQEAARLLNNEVLAQARLRHPHRSSELIELITAARLRTPISAFDVLTPPNPEYRALVSAICVPALLVIGDNGVVSLETARELQALNQRLRRKTERRPDRSAERDELGSA